MKKLICLLLALILSLSLCACDAIEEIREIGEKLNAKTFTEGNFSIELTQDFFRLDFLAEDFDFAIGSEDITIFGIHMDYSHSDPFSLSAWEYAEAIREGMNSENVTEVTDLEGIPTMQYTAVDDDGDEMAFVYAVYEASDGFWLVQYGFESDDYYELYPLVRQYALSVKCE